MATLKGIQLLNKRYNLADWANKSVKAGEILVVLDKKVVYMATEDIAAVTVDTENGIITNTGVTRLDNVDTDLSNYYTKTDVDTTLANYYTKTQVDTAVQGAKDYADGLVEAIPEQTDYTVTITENTDDTTVAKTYVFTQNGAEIGAIKLAKELVVTSGSVKEVTVADDPYAGAVVGDKYIELLIANQDTPIYVPAKDLVDIYTAKDNATEVQVAISNTNEISATLVNGGVTEEKLAEGVKTKLNKTWEEVGVAAGLVTALENGQVKTNKEAIDTIKEKPAYEITSTQVANWDNEVGAKALAETKTTAAEVKTQIEAYGYATTEYVDEVAKADIAVQYDGRNRHLVRNGEAIESIVFGGEDGNSYKTELTDSALKFMVGNITLNLSHEGIGYTEGEGTEYIVINPRDIAKTYDVEQQIADALQEAKQYAEDNDADTVYDDTALVGRVSTIEEKLPDGTIADTDDVAGALQGAKDYVDALETLVGTLPTETDATTVVEYINKKTEGIASDTALKELQNDVAENANAIAIHTSEISDLDKTVTNYNTFLSGSLGGGTLANVIDTAVDDGVKEAKDYADGLASNYATAAQGAKADTAIQGVTSTTLEVTEDPASHEVTVELDEIVTAQTTAFGAFTFDQYGRITGFTAIDCLDANPPAGIAE